MLPPKRVFLASRVSTFSSLCLPHYTKSGKNCQSNAPPPPYAQLFCSFHNIWLYFYISMCYNKNDMQKLYKAGGM